MGSFVLPLLSPPGFSIASDQRDQTLTLRFRGNADMSSIEPLDGYLALVHEEVTRYRLASVVVDFRALEFMNSSCFKCFVEWLGRVQDLPPADRYRIVFDSNREMHWQRRSLNALRCFAMDVVTIEAH
jgi:hypothetical protein